MINITYELVTLEEFVKQVLETEHIEVRIQTNGRELRMVRPYNYDPLPLDATVKDLEERIYECIKPFVYYINI